MCLVVDVAIRGDCFVVWGSVGLIFVFVCGLACWCGCCGLLMLLVLVGELLCYGCRGGGCLVV